MSIRTKLETLFSPLDIVVLEKDFEGLVPKASDVDIFPECLAFASEMISVGPHPKRNPSCWQIWQGHQPDLHSPAWNQGVRNLLRLTAEHTVTNIDNDQDYLKVLIRVEILVINAKELPDLASHGVKCVTVKTPFGNFPIDEK